MRRFSDAQLPSWISHTDQIRDDEDVYTRAMRCLYPGRPLNKTKESKSTIAQERGIQVQDNKRISGQTWTRFITSPAYRLRVMFVLLLPVERDQAEYSYPGFSHK